MALIYLHLRPQNRADQPFDDDEDDVIVIECAAQHSLAQQREPDTGDAIMASLGY